MIRKAERPLRVVLFDLDGTLIDSTELLVESYVHTYRTHGRIMTNEQITADLGMPLHDTLAFSDALIGYTPAGIVGSGG